LGAGARPRRRKETKNKNHFAAAAEEDVPARVGLVVVMRSSSAAKSSSAGVRLMGGRHQVPPAAANPNNGVANAGVYPRGSAAALAVAAASKAQRATELARDMDREDASDNSVVTQVGEATLLALLEDGDAATVAQPKVRRYYITLTLS
jgi:hypothetical protein